MLLLPANADADRATTVAGVIIQTDPSLSEQAYALTGRGYALYLAFDRRGALELWYQALHLFLMAASRDDGVAARADISTGLNNVGYGLYGLNRYELSLDYYDQALVIAREVGRQDLEATTLTNIGIVQFMQDDYEKSVRNHLQALDLFERTNRQDGVAAVLNNLAEVYRWTKDYTTALDYYNRSLTLARDVDDRAVEAVALKNLGEVNLDSGEYERALAWFIESLSITREWGHRFTEGQVLDNMGRVYERLGSYRPAGRQFEEVLDLWRHIGYRLGENQALDRLAEVHDGLAEFGMALRLHEQAYNIARSEHRVGLAISSLNNIGVVYARVGQPERARGVHLQALELARAQGVTEAQAATLMKLGAVEIALQNYDDAEARLDEARALMGGREQRAELGTLLNLLGQLRAARGDYGQALEDLSAALEVAIATSHASGRAVALTNLGHIYAAAGDDSRASSYYEEARSRWRDLENGAGEAQALVGLGVLAERARDADRALQRYYDAIGALTDVRTAAWVEDLKASLDAAAFPIFERAITLHWRKGEFLEAFNLSEQARARAFLDQLGNTKLGLSRSVSTDLIEQESTRLADVIAADSRKRQEEMRLGGRASQADIAAYLNQLKAELQSAQAAYHDTWTALSVADEQAAQLRSMYTLRLEEVQDLLNERTTLLSYFVTNDQTLVFLITHSGLVAKSVPLGEAAMKAAVERFRCAERPTYVCDAQERENALAELAHALLEPVTIELRTPVVAIIPHGSLHYLPFAALEIVNGELLGENKQLFYLTSASALRYTRAKDSGTTGPLVAFGFNKPAGLPPLNDAEKGAQQIAALFGANAVVGPDATAANLQTRAVGAGVLHIGAHAVLYEQSPLFSRILLAPEDGVESALSVRDVYGLDLSATELVVLSACETYVGERSRGDELVGLARAFTYAGASTVVASLWKVPDGPTEELMTAFYRRLRSGESKVAALQGAQREMRHKEKPASVWEWAGFVLMGEPEGNVSESAYPVDHRLPREPERSPAVVLWGPS
jgi:CHAT domain-containing protein/Tfp pilus assembly protein PilF